MTDWTYQDVPFKYQLSDWTLFSIRRQMQVRATKLSDKTPPASQLVAPSDALIEKSQGFAIRALPVAEEQPTLGTNGNYIFYTQLQYRHCFIDLGLSFKEYQDKFSSKTRATINRKLRKFAEHCQGPIPLAVYKKPDEMKVFFDLARAVSKKTYQEKLLDAGVPDSEEFLREMEMLAALNRVRGYVLFDGDRPISYLYCPIENGVLIYTYLGYDPDYFKLSVGTVLQWLALKQLFEESCFKVFDFTEGQSEHKRLFATHEIQCANVIFLKKSVRNLSLICSHLVMGKLSRWIGSTLDELGFKARIKHFIRSVR